MHREMFESVELHFPEGKVRYGNTTCPAPRNKAQRHGTKLAVTAALLASLEFPDPFWERIRLTADALGKPLFVTDTGSSPAVSFSWDKDRLWAALSLDCRGLGIDAAPAQDFTALHPLARTFGKREWRRLALLCDFASDWRAAMLWSAKEAAVKMLGCGFHLADPRDVSITVLGKDESAWHSDAILSIAGRECAVRVHSVEQKWGWISFALENTDYSPLALTYM